MVIATLSDLPPVKTRAIIINVSTRWVTTLALLSALRYLRVPILVIDCESKDGSVEHFKRLMQDHEFDLTSAPLKPHGYTLDWVFRNLKAENIWLIDSDTEILNPKMVEVMEKTIDHPGVFGSGFIHGPEWLTKTQMGFDQEKMGVYQERMWIPFSLLKREKVVEALDAGHSFIDRLIKNDFPVWPKMSRFLYRRFKKPTLAKFRLDFLKPFRKIYFNAQPNYVYCDTGADVFQYLAYERGYMFSGLTARVHDEFILHFHGITRHILEPKDTNATVLDDVVTKLYRRLKDHYGVEPLAETDKTNAGKN